MRWLWLVATLLSWMLCFTRHGAGAMMVWLLLGVLGAVATVLMFAQARIRAVARPEPPIELMRRSDDFNKPPQA
ncbi:MAG TPA: hypothetical protein VME63_08735 [Dyella sp.]|uniref:hypothetical protein n=1 Tax=Dyella sp. TaxID=1869338 RepID=UPI002C7AD8D3|nr:hypothetical protein [Dyella sp.]HTV85479.1 hypothetical protein [Dyella sp.]